MDTHPGPVRDVAVEVMADWLGLLERDHPRGAGRGRRSTPPRTPAQLAFEIEAYLLLANALFVITAEPTPIERARRALDRRFSEVATAAA